MIDPTAKLSISRQAIMLGISGGSVYHKPRPVLDADLKLMYRIDKLHMEFPFAGSRMLPGLLVQEGFRVGRLHIATLMKRMGIEALYRKRKTSKPAPGHKIYPYLLRKLPLTRPDRVWAMEITYISMARGGIGATFGHLLGVNLSSYNAMDDETKAVVDQLGKDYLVEYNRVLDEDIARVKEEWKGDLGVEVVAFPAEEIIGLVQDPKVQAVRNEWIEKAKAAGVDPAEIVSELEF